LQPVATPLFRTTTTIDPTTRTTPSTLRGMVEVDRKAPHNPPRRPLRVVPPNRTEIRHRFIIGHLTMTAVAFGISQTAAPITRLRVARPRRITARRTRRVPLPRRRPTTPVRHPLDRRFRPLHLRIQVRVRAAVPLRLATRHRRIDAFTLTPTA
jgi:hypothetical protein